MQRISALGCEASAGVIGLPLGRGETAELLGLTIEDLALEQV